MRVELGQNRQTLRDINQLTNSARIGPTEGATASVRAVLQPLAFMAVKNG